MRAEFNRDSPKDQSEQNQHHCQIKTGKGRGVGVGKSRKQCAAAGNQPDFVAIPDRADGIDQDILFLFCLSR
jgi:hypothetical protein